MPTANIVEQITIFDDAESASNPQRKHCDWRRAATGLTFDEMVSERVTLTAGNQQVLADVGAFDLSGITLDAEPLIAKPTVYRFGDLPFVGNTWATLAGVAASACTLTVGVDASVTISGAGLDTSAVLVGGLIYLSGSAYGDVGPWSAANQGFWKVISANATNGIRMQRVSGDEPTGLAETVTIAATSNIQFISEDARPRWAMMKTSVNPQFSGLRKVLYATDSWIGVEAEGQFSPLASFSFDRFTVVPKYIAYVRIESLSVLRINTTDSNISSGPHVHELVPPADGALAWYETFEFLTSLAVQNDFRSAPVSVNVIYALRQE